MTMLWSPWSVLMAAASSGIRAAMTLPVSLQLKNTGAIEAEKTWHYYGQDHEERKSMEII